MMLFDYRAKSSNDELVEGCILAESVTYCRLMLKQAGLTPVLVKVNISGSIEYFFNGSTFNPKQLMRFYRQLSLRLSAGRDAYIGLMDASEFVDDAVLKAAIVQMAMMNKTGKSLGDSMKNAGFSKRDAMTISAAEMSGETAAALKNLAKDIELTYEINKSIKGMLIEPKMLLGFALIVFYAVLTQLSPVMLEVFTKKFRIRTDELSFIGDILTFGQWTSDNLILFSGLYALFVAFIVFLFYSEQVRAIITSFGIFKVIHEKQQMIQAWSTFALLIQTGVVSPIEIAKHVAHSADEPYRSAFSLLSKRMKNGLDIPIAIQGLSFPTYIIKSVAYAAKEDFVSGVTDLINMMNSDLEDHVGQLKVTMNLLVKVLTASLVFFFVLLIVAPMVIGLLQMMK